MINFIIGLVVGTFLCLTTIIIFVAGSDRYNGGEQ